MEKAVSTAIDGIFPIASKQAASTVYSGAQGVRPLRTVIPALPDARPPDSAEVSSRSSEKPSPSTADASEVLRELREESPESEVLQVMEETNSRLSMANRSIRFRVSEYSDAMQIQIVDKERDKVIRSIPPDEMLRLASRMRELSGLGAMVDQSR